MLLEAILSHLETLVALAVLVLSRVGPLIVTSGALGSREGIVVVHCLHICQMDVFLVNSLTVSA